MSIDTNIGPKQKWILLPDASPSSANQTEALELDHGCLVRTCMGFESDSGVAIVFVHGVRISDVHGIRLATPCRAEWGK